MKNLQAAARGCAMAGALLAILLVGGCKKKKQQQQVAQAPTISTSQPVSPIPSETKPNTNGGSSPQITTTHPAAQTQTQNHPVPPKPKRKPRSTAAKDPKPANAKTDEAETATHASAPATIAQNNPPRITIEPSYPETSGGGGAISATAPHSDDIHNKLSTEQLLQSAEDNLKSIKRALTADEQSQVLQIRNFMSQSRNALAGSDSVRARNLALKAHLLSDELVRRR